MAKVKDRRFTRLGVAVSLFTLAVFGVFSLGIVSLRMEISENASTCGLLEDEREKVNRRLRALRGQRSASMRPTRLAALVKGRLSMPGVSSQFYITEGEMEKRLSSDDSSNTLPRSRKLAGNFVQ
tara:strand:- start:17 stop:391 length:375 start_codon:yes stop_codon:yes gene_type:complete